MTRSALPVIVAARRTPIETIGMRLAGVAVDSLAASVVSAVAQDAQELSVPGGVADVILGNCMGPGGNPARVASLAAGLGTAVPGLTVDRQCGSGLTAIILAADGIRAGDPRLRIAGGVESASTAPARILDGERYARAPFAPAGFPDPEMGPAAQRLAERHGIGRAAQDAYAARSHALACDAQTSGRFDDELVAVAGVTRDGGPRSVMAAMLPRFEPLYPDAERFSPESEPGAEPTVTAGNTSRISDGAAAVALIPDEFRAGRPGLALIAAETTGCDPALPGIGPVDAVLAALAKARLTLADVDAFEIVEAYAAQTLAVLTRLELAEGDRIDPRVCADGGALAFGHPWGASSAVSVVRLFSRLVRAGAPAGTIGVATAAIGGGMGVAAVFQVVR